ncbi:tetratricopeptide repeat protein [Streptomyces sp. Y7]|uniref:tetratricopeptide repeat protein n=1 Tax=Streptomyces sp. Y7 TaxID=3342392 RepID=UPI003710C273
MPRLSRAKKREHKHAADAAHVAAPIDVHVPVVGPGAGGASVGGVPVTAAPGEEIQHVVLAHLQRIALAGGRPVHATVHDERIGYVVPLLVETDGSSRFTADPVRTGPPATPTAQTTPASADPGLPGPPASADPAPNAEPHPDKATHVLRPMSSPAQDASPTFRLRAFPEPVGDTPPGTVAPPLGEFGPPPLMGQPTDARGDALVDAFTAAPVDAHTETPGEAPTETPLDVRMDTSVDTPADTSVGALAAGQIAGPPAPNPKPAHATQGLNPEAMDALQGLNPEATDALQDLTPEPLDALPDPTPEPADAPPPSTRIPVSDPTPLPVPTPAAKPAPASDPHAHSRIHAHPDPALDPDPKPAPPRGFDAIAEAVLGDPPSDVTADVSPFAEPMGRINDAVTAGRTAEAARLAERTVAEASAVLGPQHPEVLRIRELGAYIAYLGGDPERAFALALDVARRHHSAGDAEAAYGSLHGAATAWRAVRDPAQGLRLGRDLLGLWDELTAEGGPAADDVEELESAHARMDRLAARAAKSAEPPNN